MVIPGSLIGRLTGGPLRLVGADRADRLSFARPSGATVLDASGTMQEVAANLLRFNGTARRILLEGQRTNAIRNPRGEGGGPGILPTNWSRQGSTGFVNVVGVGVENGAACVDIQISGTGTGSNTALAFEGNNGIAVSDAELWSASIHAALIGGSMAGINNLSISLQGVSGAFSPSTATFMPNASMIRYSVSGTAGTGTTFLQPRLLFSVAASVTVNATIRLWLPQAERGGFATSPITPPVGTLAAATRAADSLTALATTLFPGGAGTILLACTIPQAASAADQTLLQIDDGTASNALLLRNPAGTATILAGRILAGAAANTAASAGFAAGMPMAIGFAFDGNGLSMLLRGDTEKTLATAMPSGLATLRLGAGLAGANALFGELGDLRVLPYRASAAEMALRLASL